MLNSYHFQTHDLMRVKATEVGPLITLMVSGLNLGLTPDELDED